MRGRKKYQVLKVNDVIDFWRIEDIKRNKRLLLRAEMLTPGRAWLEFNIKEEEGRRRLSLTAHYDTDILSGKIYWYVCMPFHHFIFTKLLQEIDKRGKDADK